MNREPPSNNDDDKTHKEYIPVIVLTPWLSSRFR